jgi:hypothetical protein
MEERITGLKGLQRRKDDLILPRRAFSEELLDGDPCDVEHVYNFVEEGIKAAYNFVEEGIKATLTAPIGKDP